MKRYTLDFFGHGVDPEMKEDDEGPYVLFRDIQATMTTETNTTDFDTVRACLDTAPNNQRAWYVVNRIEASHAALVAQRDALLTAMEAMLADHFSKSRVIRTQTADKACAAIALSKGK